MNSQGNRCDVNKDESEFQLTEGNSNNQKQISPTVFYKSFSWQLLYKNHQLAKSLNVYKSEQLTPMHTTLARATMLPRIVR